MLKMKLIKTDWMITSNNRGIYDILIIEKAVTTFCEVFDITKIQLLEQWYNYIVLDISEFVQNWEKIKIFINKIIEEEVLTQIKIKSVSCQPSCHKVNLKTEKIIWIVSFLASMKGFPLFNVSEKARLIEKRFLTVRHNSECQRFCHSSKYV